MVRRDAPIEQRQVGARAHTASGSPAQAEDMTPETAVAE